MDNAQRQDSDRLFMLNVSMLGVVYLSQVVTLACTNVRTNNGLTLPAEIWEQIFDAVLLYEENDKWDEFNLVRPKIISTSADYVLARCVRTTLTCTRDGRRGFGQLRYTSSRMEASALVSFATITAGFSIERHTQTESSCYVKIYTHPDRFSCLFSGVTVPDIISRIEHGNCGLCKGRRLICKGDCHECRQLDRLNDLEAGAPPGMCKGHQPELCSVCVGLELRVRYRERFDRECTDYADEFSEAQKAKMSWLCRELFRLGYSVRPGRLMDTCKRPYTDTQRL